MIQIEAEGRPEVTLAALDALQGLGYSASAYSSLLTTPPPVIC